MDKENKTTDQDNNSLYDPDAAELLKDMDDDDEDEGIDYVPTSDQNNALVNMLTSSANLESYASSPVLNAIPSSLKDPSKDKKDREDKGSLEISTGRISTELGKNLAKSSQDLKPVVETKSASENSTETEEDTDSEQPEETPKNKKVKKIDANSDASPKIKPFEHKTEPPTPPSSSPKDKDKEKENKLDALAETVDSRITAENEHEKETKPSTSGSKRPPVPPPAAPKTTPQVEKSTSTSSDNNISIDALNDLLPGGKNDEARDLAAFKFNDNEWYTKVFNEDFFRTIPKNSRRQTIREAKFIRHHLGLEKKARVLDLCCGYGRHTIELSKAGFDMVGLDLSMTMLKRALKDAQNSGQAIKFVHGDMRKLAFKSVFDAIYNVDTSFGYFDDLSNFKVLQGIFRALKPGGVFLIETMNRDFAIDEFPLRLWWKGIDCTLLEEIDMDCLSGVLQVQRSFVFDGNTRPPWEQKIQIRLYSVTEMRALLKRAGFNVVELSGDYSLPGAHFGAASPKNIFVAEKPVK